MNIHLMNPPVHHYAGVHYRMNPPLGLPIIAAVLQNAGHQARVTDLEALQISPEALAQRFTVQCDDWPDAIGFTVTTHNARGMRESVEALRDIGYNGYIAIGGPHVTMIAGEHRAFQEFFPTGADVYVVGECEGNVVDIFEQRRTGLIYGEPAAIEDIPGPLWACHEPTPTDYYGNLPKVGHPEGISMWSRGCPHKCSFCANPVFAHQPIRYRPAANIVADMAGLKGLGVESVFVYDDEAIGLNRVQAEWLMGVCERVAPLGLTWKCQGRCSEKWITEDVLEAMYDAGCRAIMWGVESFSNRVLRSIRKGTTEDDVWHTLRVSREAGIGNWLFLMVGNYGETRSDLAYTEQQLSRARQEGLVQWRQVTVCTPVQGTELYRKAREEGWLVEAPQSGPQMAQAYNATPWLTKREIRYWRNRLQVVGA